MPYNILLVDDDEIFREELSECLEDYGVIEASTGGEALEILKKPNEIDIVLLDVMMPGRRGTDVLSEIKRLEPEMSVIMLTGHSSKDIAIDALRGNADDYIEKPVDVPLLLESIRNQLHGRDGSRDEYPPGAEGKIAHVAEFLARNYQKRVSLDDVAGLVCLSPKYLSRLFKEKTGKGFNEYRLGVKMEKAGEMLRETGLTVNEISYRLGYSNMESFIRMFKKTKGMTPTEYRKAAADPAERPEG
jgi:YesN/AraC family two-component response regulator